MEIDPVTPPVQHTHIILRADVRENASGIPPILANEYGINVVQMTLKVGDYCVDPDVLIERKTVLDFAQSIIDGRLFKQAASMKKCFERPIMIVEGDLRNLHESINIHPHAVKGALISMALAWQITVLFSKDKQETALLLWLIATQETKSIAELSYRPGRRPKRLHKRQLYILQGLPGVGPKTAAELLSRFGSTEKVMTALEQDLMRIRGLGKKKSGKIREILTADCGT